LADERKRGKAILISYPSEGDIRRGDIERFSLSLSRWLDRFVSAAASAMLDL
jgi:hypothetical protein